MVSYLPSSVLLLFLFACISANRDDAYCNLSCDFGIKKYPHTVCSRQKEKCGSDPKCGKDFREIKFTDNMRQYALDLHNYLRNKVAMGNETRNGQPPAADMNILTYNRELESIAQCWANTCNGNPLLHDKCRRTAQYDHVGQNLGYINSSSPNINPHHSMKELIMLWYNEVAIFNSSWIFDTKDRGPKYKVGHYTQMIWADTTEMGCAATYYTTPSYDAKKKWNHIVFVCNYGPGGNYLGVPVYRVGQPTSKCADGLKPNKHYRGLCGTSKFVIPILKKFDSGSNL